MSNCPDLCTAAKCAELEERINSLESQLSTLYSEFIFHTQTQTSDAHDFDVAVTGLLKYDFASGGVGMDVYLVRVRDSNLLSTGRVISQSLPYVFEWDFNAHKAEKIPEAHPYEPNVLIDIFEQDNGSFVIKSQVDNSFDEDTFNDKPLELTIDEISNDNDELIYEIAVALGENKASNLLILDKNSFNNIDIDDLNEYIDDYFDNLDFFFRIDNLSGNDYEFTIQLGNKARTEILDLPLPSDGGGGGSGSEEELPPLTVVLEGTYNEIDGTLDLLVSVDGSAATAIIDITELIMNETLDKIWAVMGGDDTWTYNDADKTVTLNMQPETDIKTTGRAQYSSETETGNNIEVGNILQLITSLHSVNYYRDGYHRLPATTIESLLNTPEGNKELKIHDSLSFQEWTVRNLDALMGEFPLKLKYKNEDKEEEAVFTNLSEILTEITGVLISLAEDSNSNLALTSKALVEARAAANAAITATDYAVANAEYLGYPGKEVEKKIKVSFTPGMAKMADVLKPSVQNIIGWELTGEETLTELVKRVLIGAEIIRAAMYIPWKPGEKITGDAIRENKEAEQQETWEAFINKVNNPTGVYKINKPDAKIKDIG